MKVIMYGTHLCKDTLYAIYKLEDKGADLEFRSISASLKMCIRDSLQPGLYYERTGHGAGVKGSYRGRDQGVFSRKSLPLQRIYVPASCS